MIEIHKGLDLPIEGLPQQEIDGSRHVSRVAVMGPDYVGLKPTMAVQKGDRVKLGQLLFSDKTTDGVQFTSPGCGVVQAVNRGGKRRFQSVEIELDGEDEVEFHSFADRNLPDLTHEEVRDNLVQSGLWTALRTRPFSRIPSPSTSPHSLFVTAIDTNPLAVDPAPLISENVEDFRRGLQLLARLTTGTVYVCTKRGAEMPEIEEERVQVEQFAGPHPAGLAGTHIHYLDPVGPNKTVWTIGYQDVIAIGKLFVTGRVSVDRVVSLAGPAVERPRLLRTRIGANVTELVADELADSHSRIVSGSVFSGRNADGPFAYLGRYHQQISVLAEGDKRVLFDWLRPGFNRFSVKNVYASALGRGSRRFPFTTSQEGSSRAMVPIGMYEQVMPLDILPTFLLRALIVQDTDQAQALGCLELDEEDLALCSFVCPGKYEYGPLLRSCLQRIEDEG